MQKFELRYMHHESPLNPNIVLLAMVVSLKMQPYWNLIFCRQLSQVILHGVCTLKPSDSTELPRNVKRNIVKNLSDLAADETTATEVAEIFRLQDSEFMNSIFYTIHKSL